MRDWLKALPILLTGVWLTVELHDKWAGESSHRKENDDDKRTD